MYWDGPGPKNTADTVRAAAKRASELGIEHFVISSNTGESALALLEVVAPPEANVVVVTHHVGYREPGDDEMSAEMREKLRGLGCKVLTTTHLFANVERAITHEFGGLYPGGIISAALRMFGQGTKVAIEISVMALDAGLIPYGVDVVSIGGTGRGVDTALVLRPAHARLFFKTEVKEIICKPRAVRREKTS